jgi:S-formylglutathione hydrolase FrmB
MDTSIIDGWVPAVVQGLAFLVVGAAIGLRSRRWWLRSFPVALALGFGAVVWTRWFIASEGMAGEPVPRSLWVWIALTGLTLALAPLAWRGAGGWRRTASLVAVPLCLVCSAMNVNGWVGYARTVQAAWDLTSIGPLPNQLDISAARMMAVRNEIPHRGRIVPVTINDKASHFKHREELVYLPPVWFTSSPPPALPLVMMIGGEFGSSADWIVAGNAADTLDDFAAGHRGVAPVVVFVDKGGSFNKDTECVNGTRGNAADHLTEDVLPFMAAAFGVSRNPAKNSVVGWSMGGTCALTLAVTHPELFNTFVDISGDEGPNVGTRDQTIERLYGGDAEAWAAFDPMTVMAKHGPYDGVSGVFAVEDTVASADGRAPRAEAAERLCATASAADIDCWVKSHPGKHDWAFGADVFARTLPWLWSQSTNPGVQAFSDPDGGAIG